MPTKLLIISKRASNKSCWELNFYEKHSGRTYLSPPGVDLEATQKWMQFPFLYKLITNPYHLSSPLAPLWGETYAFTDFFFEIRCRKTFIWSFFGIWHIFGSVQPKSEYIFPFLYNLIFQLNTGDNHVSSPVAIKNGVCPHLGCSSALSESAGRVAK